VPKINICFFLGSYSTGGAEDHVLQIIRNIDRNTFSLHLIVFNGTGKNKEKFYSENISILELRPYKNKYAKHILRLFNFIPASAYLKSLSSTNKCKRV